MKLEIDPKSTLSGLVPRLVDEWQEYPGIWNYIRREVDDRKAKGQFILTGSANPEERVRLHSGAGRFSVFKMRPMSFYEKGWSTGEVGLAGLMKGSVPASESAAFDLGELAEKLTLGGWPSLIGANAREGRHICVLQARFGNPRNAILSTRRLPSAKTSHLTI
jgi:predicted AAA+ superfamily ATPase